MRLPTLATVPLSTGWACRFLLGFTFAVSIALVIAALRRGPWLDEFATVYFADPTLSWWRILDERWLNETNPPTYYALVRLWAELLGTDPVIGRLLNVVPLGAVAVWFAWAWRVTPVHRRFLATYGVMALSNRIVTGYFPEERSYFFQFAAEIVFFGASYLSFVERRRRPDGAQLLAVPFLICLHQVTAIYAAAMIGALILVDLHRRCVARALALAAVTVVSLGLLVAFTVMQLSRGGVVPGWIEPHDALWGLIRVLSLVLTGPRLDWWIVALGLVLLWLKTRWPRPVLDTLEVPSMSRLRFAGLILAALGLATCIAIGINGYTPILVTRYFTGVSAAGTCLFAILAQDFLFVFPLVAILFGVDAVISFGANAWNVARERGWDLAAERVATLARTCPGTRIYGGSNPTIDHESVGYEYYGRKLGLAVAPLGASRDGGETGCPMIFWIGHFDSRSAPNGLRGPALVEATNRAAGLGLTPAERARATAEAVDRGAIVVVAPPT